MALEERESGPAVALGRRLARSEEARLEVELDPAGRRTVPEVHARCAWSATVRATNGTSASGFGDQHRSVHADVVGARASDRARAPCSVSPPRPNRPGVRSSVPTAACIDADSHPDYSRNSGGSRSPLPTAHAANLAVFSGSAHCVDVPRNDSPWSGPCRPPPGQSRSAETKDWHHRARSDTMGCLLIFFADDSRHPFRTTFKLSEGDFYFPSLKVIRKRGFALAKIARAHVEIVTIPLSQASSP